MKKDLENYILHFDGICNLCNKFVQFTIRNDKQEKFKFAALLSEVGQRILLKHNLSISNLNTFILLKKDKVYTKSTAAFYLLREHGSFWHFFKYSFLFQSF